MRQVIAEDMADGYNPPEYSPTVTVRRRQRTPQHPYLQDIIVTYDRRRGAAFVSQLKSSILWLFQIINIRMSLDFEVENASMIEALRIKSQNGRTYTVALNQNGGRY